MPIFIRKAIFKFIPYLKDLYVNVLFEKSWRLMIWCYLFQSRKENYRAWTEVAYRWAHQACTLFDYKPPRQTFKRFVYLATFRKSLILRISKKWPRWVKLYFGNSWGSQKRNKFYFWYLENIQFNVSYWINARNASAWHEFLGFSFKNDNNNTIEKLDIKVCSVDIS